VNVCVYLCMYHFSRTLKVIVCGSDPIICIYTDNVCNREVFLISFPQFVQEAKYEKSVHSWWKKNVALSTVSVGSTLHLFFIFFGTGFEVLTVVRIHNAVRVRTPCSLVHGYECFGGGIWVCLHRQSENGAVCPARNLGTHQSDYTAP
jgi:hypothetical protein